MSQLQKDLREMKQGDKYATKIVKEKVISQVISQRKNRSRYMILHDFAPGLAMF